MAVAVGSAVVPVINHIVKQIEPSNGAVLTIHAATHRPVTAFAVHQQIVVPRTDASVNGGRIAMVRTVGIVLVTGNAQSLADDTILE